MSNSALSVMCLASAASQVSTGLTDNHGKGVQLAADMNAAGSPETYIGYQRAESFASSGGVIPDQPHVYQAPPQPALNQWGLAGEWRVGPEQATSTAPGGHIVYRFHARDLHLVLGPDGNGKPVHFKVLIDGNRACLQQTGCHAP